MEAEYAPRRYTVEEYFALEERGDARHEFFEGEVFAMAGESTAHNLIALNIAAELRVAVRGRGCRVFMEGIQLAVREGRHYAYPDVMVTCDPDDLQAPRRVRHPVLLVEVLSPSTAAYDRRQKFRQYKQLPALRHYLLVSQSQWLVEWFRRTPEDGWLYEALTGPAERLAIPELNLELTVAQIYEDAGVAPLRLTPPPTDDDAESPDTDY